MAWYQLQGEADQEATMEAEATARVERPDRRLR